MKKSARKSVTACLLAMAASCGGTPASEGPAIGAEPETEEPSKEQASVLIEGHRGGRGLWPENSLVAFGNALALGVDVLELDCGMTSDDVVVVHHDPRLTPDLARDSSGAWLSADETGHGPPIRVLSREELRSYDVGKLRPGSAYAMRFPTQAREDGVRIPLLREVLEMAETRSNSSIRYNIETKLDPREPELTATPEEMARAILGLLREHGVIERATVQSFDWRSLQVLRETEPKLKRSCLSVQSDDLDTVEVGRPGASPWTAGLDVDDLGGSVPRLVHAAGCHVWSPRLDDVDKAKVDEAHELGLKVAVWTVNTPEDIRRALSYGVDSIISDYPDRVREVFAAEGLALPPAFAE